VTTQRPVRFPLNVHVTGRRIVATWIDLFLVGVLYRLLARPLHLPLDLDSRLRGASGSATTDYASRLAHSSGAVLAYAVILGVYFVALEGLWGRTVGKLLTGIRVVRLDTGGPAGFGQVLVRTVFRVLDGIGGYLVGFVVTVLSRRRQRIGDMAAGTLVVRV